MRTPRDAERRATWETARRRVVGLTFIVYGLLIFEGALRRWLLPEYEEILFFIRVPVVALCYWIVLKHGLWPRAGVFMKGFLLFSCLALFLIPIQMSLGDYDARHLMLAGYGWHNYFYYIPLAFIIGSFYSRDDLLRLMRFTALIAVPMMLLVFAQFNAPPTAPINVGFAQDEIHKFRGMTVVVDRIRPTGTFTSSAGLGDFITSLIAMLFAGWMSRAKDRPFGTAALIGTTLAALSMIALSGSRGLFLSIALIAITAMIAGYLTGRKRIVLQTSVLLPMLGVVFLIGFPLVFPSAFDAFFDRWTSAYAAEREQYALGIIGRALHNYYWFLLILPDTPIAGYLLGMGGNAAHQLGWVMLPEAIQAWDQPVGWAEDPLSQHVIELGPILGLLYIVFRFGFTLWIGLRCLQATRRRGDPLPLTLFSFVGLMMAMAQMTGNGTHMAYTWIFVGLCLAASRPERTPSKLEKCSARARSN